MAEWAAIIFQNLDKPLAKIYFPTEQFIVGYVYLDRGFEAVA